MSRENQKKIDPLPGHLVAWMKQQISFFCTLAVEGTLLDATLKNFEIEFTKRQNEYANSEKYPPEVLRDSELALLQMPFYLEQVEKSKTKHQFWRENLLQIKSHNLAVFKDLGQQLGKYILVGYGVVFVTILSKMDVNGTSTEIKFNLSIALLSLCVGFLFAIMGNILIFFGLTYLIKAQQHNLLNGQGESLSEKKSLFWSNLGQYSVGFSGILLVAAVCIFPILNWLDIQTTNKSIKYFEIDDR